MDQSSLLNRLRELVLSGELAPGTRLTEEALADRLGVSRTPIRSALPALASEGLIATVGRRGYAVKGYSHSESVEALELRALLEGHAARLLAQRGASAGTLDDLRACLADGDALFAAPTFDRQDEQKYGVINARFHDMIVAAAGSDLTAGVIARLNRIPFVSPGIIVFDQPGPRAARSALLRAHHQHHDIFDAIVERDGHRAETLFREHARRQRNSMFEHPDADPE